MSSVFYDKLSLEEVARDADHIVRVQCTGPGEEYRRVVFPKETSHQGREEIYTETFTPCRIISVVRSATLKPGSSIKVWQQPAYDEGSIHFYHETGGLESPVLRRYLSAYPYAAGAEHFLLLRDKDPANGVYHDIGSDGLEIEATLRSIPESDAARPQAVQPTN